MGTLTDNGTPIAADQWVTLNSLNGWVYTGSASSGTDKIWLIASDGQSSEAVASISDPGTPEPVVTADNQSVAAGQQVALSSLFSISGSGINQYKVRFSYPEGGSPAVGTLTDNGAPIAGRRDGCRQLPLYQPPRAPQLRGWERLVVPQAAPGRRPVARQWAARRQMRQALPGNPPRQTRRRRPSACSLRAGFGGPKWPPRRRIEGRRAQRPADPAALPTDRRRERASPGGKGASCLGQRLVEAGRRRRRAAFARSVRTDCSCFGGRPEIRRIEIVLSSDPTSVNSA